MNWHWCIVGDTYRREQVAKIAQKFMNARKSMLVTDPHCSAEGDTRQSFGRRYITSASRMETERVILSGKQRMTARNVVPA